MSENQLIEFDVSQLEYDEIGKEAVKKVLKDYKNTAAALEIFDINSDGPVKGSSIYSRFALVNAGREITKENLMPITPKESEIALKNNALTDFKGNYEDLGLVVYPREGANARLWKYSRQQVKSNFPEVDLKIPFVMTGLMDVVKDKKYENGLRLDINQLTEVYNVPILTTEEIGEFDTEDLELLETGFPSKLGKGSRNLYSSDDGVRRFWRDGDLNLSARSSKLAEWAKNGRLNFTRNFSSKNLEDLLKEVNEIKEKGSFSQKFEILQKLNKKIDYLTNKEKYEEAFKIQTKKDDLYKSLR